MQLNAMPAFLRCCGIDLVRRICDAQRSCACVWLVLQRSMLPCNWLQNDYTSVAGLVQAENIKLNAIPAFQRGVVADKIYYSSFNVYH